MRARNIKPGLYKNAELAELVIEARYLFPGLWMLADCEGRLKDQPKWIRAEIFPYDPEIGSTRVDELLQMLADAGFIRRYSVDSIGYIEIVNWHKHQNPHKKEREAGSDIPAPDQIQTGPKPEPVPEIPAPAPENPELEREIPALARLIPDSGFRIPDSGFQGDAAFEELWTAYPAKARVKRVLAQQYYSEEVRTAEQHAHVMDRLRSVWAKSDKWHRGFVLSLPEWIHNRSWDEEPEPYHEEQESSGPVYRKWTPPGALSA